MNSLADSWRELQERFPIIIALIHAYRCNPIGFNGMSFRYKSKLEGKFESLSELKYTHCTWQQQLGTAYYSFSSSCQSTTLLQWYYARYVHCGRCKWKQKGVFILSHFRKQVCCVVNLSLWAVFLKDKGSCIISFWMTPHTNLVQFGKN